jgi:hypothetical protein
MMRTVVHALTVVALLLVTDALLAAPAQSAPGQIAPNNVVIQNRGRSQAVPVLVQNDQREPPLRVQLFTRGDENEPALRVRMTESPGRQLWEYREVTATADQRAIDALNAAGRDGWELSGSAVAVPNGLLFVMKRPK